MKWYRIVMIVMWSIMIADFSAYWLIVVLDKMHFFGVLQVLENVFMQLCVLVILTCIFFASAAVGTLLKQPRSVFNWIMLVSYPLAAAWIFHFSQRPDYFCFWGCIID